MKKLIALFGPPGVGKSTLIKIAREKGIIAYDLEEEGETLEERKNSLKRILESEMSEFILFGSADLGPKDFPDNTQTILLLPPKKIFLERSIKRDSDMPHKSGQNAEYVYDLSAGWQSEFKEVIKDLGSPEVILNQILDL